MSVPGRSVLRGRRGLRPPGARSELRLQQRKRYVQICSGNDNRLRRGLLLVPTDDAAKRYPPHAAPGGIRDIFDLDERPEVLVTTLGNGVLQQCIDAVRVEERVAVPA